MSGCPGRPNLLLAALGPGLSACLLDLFMMSAGPNLRGKIAHAEVDIFSAFLPTPGQGGEENSRHVVGCRTGPGVPGVVAITAVVFLVLCWRYDPALQTAHGGGGSSGDVGYCSDDGTKGSANSRRFNSEGFEKALRSCEAHCSEWVPRFHPHELLEVDLQASWAEFDLLARVLEARTVSVERLPDGKDLARMSVSISPRADGDAVAAACGTTRGVAVQEQTEDEDRDKRTSEGNNTSVATEEGAAPGGSSPPVVLTVIDNASRLMPPVDDAEMGPATTPPPAGAGGRANKKQAMAAKSGLFPALLRVNRALREHRVALSGRFKRAAAVCTLRQKGECPPSAYYASPHRVLNGAQYQQSELPASNGETSAFDIYTHSGRCQDFAGRSPTCLEGERGSSLEGAPSLARALPPTIESPSSTTAAAASNGGAGAAIVIGPSNLGAENVPTTSQSTDTTARSCRGGHYCNTRSPEDGGKISLGARDNDGHTPTGGDVTSMQTNGFASPQVGDDTFSTQRTIWRRERNCKPRRISPPTNVVTATPLPQIACMAGICRVCADVARGVRERINELEALMTTGTARSGQRRAYAATLGVAGTLMRFLALTQAAVEAFVIEWDRQELQGAGGTCTTTTSANNTRGNTPPPPVSESAASFGAPVDTMPVGSPPPPLFPDDDDGGSRAAAGPSPLLAAPATRRALPGAETRLAFLRRLAAVNGALGLCVLQGAGSSAGGEERLLSGAPGSKAGATTTTGGGGVQRKGYVQALGELASFLETKAARRGFAGL